ncbi:MAG: TIGR02206 family membrane protein, partial [Mycobacterium sp.]
LLVVWAAIYLTWGRRIRPQWRSYRVVVVVTVVWAAVTFVFNSIAGTDYGFLNGKPDTASLLDVLGPWPAYLLTAATLILIVWALMTWPWEWARRRGAAQ